MAKRREEVEPTEDTPPIFAPLPVLKPVDAPTGSLPVYGPGYVRPPPKEEGGGFWGGVVDVITAPVKLVEIIAAPVIDAGGKVLDVARDSVLLQAAAAVATGGLSLVGQAVYETASGQGGPVTSVAGRIVNDPLSIVTELPGVVLTEGGLIGTVANVVSIGGAAVEGVFGEDSTIGHLGGSLSDAVESVQGAAREDPVASLTFIAGVAATAIGLPVGPKLISGAAASIAANAATPDQPTNPGIVPPGPMPTATAQAQPAPATSDATGLVSTLRRRWPVAAGLLVAVGAVAIASALDNSPTPSKS
jgi:hypothetical protein